MKKTITTLAVIFAVCAGFTACDTDAEPLNLQPAYKYSEEYYANLRAYKDTFKERSLCFVWFSDYDQSYSMAYRFAGLPDSVDICSLWGLSLIHILTYNARTGVIYLNTANIPCNTSWKEGKIVLSNTPLKDALRMIGNKYNVSFNIRNDELLGNTFTGTFSNQSLDLILKFSFNRCV